MFILIQTLLLLTSAPPGSSGGDEYQLWQKARRYWYDEDWSQAAATYKEHLELYPGSIRRCKSMNYLGYCYQNLGKPREAFSIFTELIENGTCSNDTVDDAKMKRLQIAYELVREEPAMKKVLLDSLADPSPDIRLSSAVWLSELNDNSGIEIFFQVLKTEDDLDRRDTAARHILKIGSERDKARLKKILDEFKAKHSDRKPRMIRLTIYDLKDKTKDVEVNLPLRLFRVIVDTLREEDIVMIKDQVGLDLKKLNLNALEEMDSGTDIVKIINGDNKEIRLFLE